MKYQEGYKYQLAEDYIQEIRWLVPYKYVSNYLSVIDGVLTCCRGYAWDGASGPAWDTDNFMVPSLVHDALYQLMRLGVIPHRSRKLADALLYSMCLERNMWRIRAWYVLNAVRIFGGSAARKPRKVLTAE